MDEKFNDIHYENELKHTQIVVRRQVIIKAIYFVDNKIEIHVISILGNEKVLIIPKLEGYRLIID